MWAKKCRTPSALSAMDSPKRISCSSIRVEIHFRSHQALDVQSETSLQAPLPPRIESCSHEGATVDLLDHWRVRRWLSNGIAKVTTSASGFISCFGSMSKCVARIPKLVIHPSRVALHAVWRCVATRLVRCRWATQDRTSGSTLSTPRHAGSLSNAEVVALSISELHAACQLHKFHGVSDFTAVSCTMCLDAQPSKLTCSSRPIRRIESDVFAQSNLDNTSLGE